jgi:hypothetical protein
VLSLLIYIVFTALTFIILLFAFYQWQHFMVFTPTYYREEILDERFEYLSVKTDDNKELEGIVYNHSAPHATLLFFGGRSHDSVGLIKRLSQTYPHARVITFNYRSYGRSEGIVSEKNILADGLKIAQLVQKHYGDFYLLGFSIGSVVSAYIASKTKVKGVFLIGSFDSIGNLAKSRYAINFRWFLRYKFDNTKYVQHIEAPTYLFVSKHDEITFIQNSQNLKSYVKNLALYKELENLSHKELLWDKQVSDPINEVLGA